MTKIKFSKEKVAGIKPRFDGKENYCSENALATILASIEGVEAKQDDLNANGCYDIFTIARCLRGYLLLPINADVLKASIDRDLPVIASIVPDTNFQMFKSGALTYEDSLHSVVIYGYSPDYLHVVDFGQRIKVDIKTFMQQWERNKFLGYVKDAPGLIPPGYPSK